MSQRKIDFGTFPDDPDADAIRTAFQKVQQNFDELYTGVGSGVTSIVAGQGIELGGTGSSTGAVTIEADIACIQVQSSTLSLGVLGSSSDESYVLIPSSSQVLTVDLPANIVAQNLDLTGNLSVAGDINLGNSVTANYFIGDGSLLTNITVSAGTSIVNGNSNVVVDANGNVRTSVTGVSNVLTVTNTGINVKGNTTANFFIGDGGLLSNISGLGSGNSISSGNSNVVVDANGNVRTSVTGNANVLVVHPNGAGVTGYLNVSSNATIGSGNGGNITGANVIFANTFIGYSSANLGNSVTANFFIGDGGLLSNISGLGSGNSISSGNSNVVVDANGNVRTSVSGNANVLIAHPEGFVISGYLDVSSNANLGNSATANFFIGDGGLLSNITVAGGTAIVNGSSNVIVDANGNVRTSVTGNANVLVVNPSGVGIAGYLNISGNATLGTGAGGNITGVNVLSANVINAALTANIGNLQVTSTDILVSANIIPTANVAYDLGSNNYRFNDLYLAGNTIYIGSTTLSSSNNTIQIEALAVTSNLNVDGNTIFASGDGGSLAGANAITANYFIGDGSFLSNVFGNTLSSGTSNVIIEPNANVRISVENVANVALFTPEGVDITGNLTIDGDIILGTGTGGNISEINYLTANFFVHSVGSGITANGSGQSDATVLTKEINVVSTVNSGNGVRLPTTSTGLMLTLFNTSANSLQVYPSSGSGINGLGVNNPITQESGTGQQFIAITSSQWFTLTSASGNVVPSAITFRSAQTASTTTVGQSSLAITKPSGLAVGDLMLLVIMVTENSGPAGQWGNPVYPSGFVETANVQADVNAWNKTFVAYKIANAGDVAASSFSTTYTEDGGPYRIIGSLLAYYNVNTSTPIDVTPTTQNNEVNTTNVVAPSITPSNSQAKQLVTVYAITDGNAQTDSIDITPPVSQTQRAEIVAVSPAFSRFMVADQAYQSVSATGTRTATHDGGTVESMAISILLRSG